MAHKTSKPKITQADIERFEAEEKQAADEHFRTRTSYPFGLFKHNEKVQRMMIRDAMMTHRAHVLEIDHRVGMTPAEIGKAVETAVAACPDALIFWNGSPDKIDAQFRWKFSQTVNGYALADALITGNRNALTEKELEVVEILTPFLAGRIKIAVKENASHE